MSGWLEGKAVLITGAAGTVGRGLLEQVLAARPRVVRALDHFEYGLFELQQQYGDPEEARWLLGDVRDAERLRRAMQGIDVVLHAAALKHVPIGEYNPFEIVQTNLIGLQNVIQSAIENNVERVIFTSSDKAVNPTNAMGASKLMGERLVAAANEMRGTAPTRFVSVRFGNILGSNGSVVDVFRRQILAGEDLTLTDRRMTRFVMGLANAVRLVLRAAEMAVGGEVFVLKMPALRIADMAEVLIRALRPDLPPARWPAIREVGAKAGEKLFEELLAESEIARAYEDDELIVYLGERAELEAARSREYLRHMRPVTANYHSGFVPLMGPDAIEEFLSDLRLIERRNVREGP